MTTETAMAPADQADDNSNIVQGTALVERPGGGVMLAPRNTGDLYVLSKGLAGSGLIPTALRGKPADIMVICLTALELDVPLMTGLRQISVINGKPFIESQLLHAIALRSPLCEYVRLIETSDEQATWEAKRRGSPPRKLTWTIEMAARAGLTGGKKDNWTRHPAAMLRARALGALVRVVFPEVCTGVYVDGEQGSQTIDVEASVTPVPASADAKPITGDPTLAAWEAEAEAI